MRMKGDVTVNACLDSQLERESTWKSKSLMVVRSNRIIVPIVENNTPPIQLQTLTTNQTINKAKKLVKKTFNADVKDQWDGKVKSLLMQGDFESLLIEEKHCVTWQSIARKLP